MGTVRGLSVAMPWPGPIPRWRLRTPMPDLNEIDWKDTAALFASLISGGVIGRALFWPLFDYLVHKVLKERIARYEKATSEVEKLDERLNALEANRQLADSLEELHEDVEFIRDLRRDEERRGHRREGSPLMPGGRRTDDPPRRRGGQ